MFPHVYDNVLKATESTVQLQQALWKSWTHPWWAEAVATAAEPEPEPEPVPEPEATWPEQFEAYRKQWSRSMDDLLARHRATLDAQCDAGIKSIRAAFRTGRDKDPADLRRGVEATWKEAIARTKAATAQQLDEFRAASDAWFEAIAAAFPAER